MFFLVIYHFSNQSVVHSIIQPKFELQNQLGQLNTIIVKGWEIKVAQHDTQPHDLMSPTLNFVHTNDY